MPQSWIRAVCVAGVLLSGALSPAGSHATTVIQLGTQQLLTTAELVFEGEAIEISTRRASGSGSIKTFVTFAISEVIKGTYSGGTIELGFSGGRLDNEIVGIAGMIYPTLGERGVYFVEKTGRAQVHPMFGWTQGHFIVDAPAAGNDARVYTAGFRPVFDLELTSVDFGASYSRGEVAGLVTSAPFVDARPIALGDFKARLRGFMQQLNIPEPITQAENQQ